MVALRTSLYASAEVRDECRWLFRWKTAGDVPPVERTGLSALVLIVAAAVLAAGLFTLFVPKDSLCSYVSPIEVPAIP
jgi:hypothetical protein